MPKAFLRLGLAVAMSTALWGAALGFPLALAPLAVLVPLPGLVVATRGPSTECSLWFLFTLLAVTAAFGSDVGPGFILLFGIPSLVVAVGIRRFWSFEHTAVAGIATWCAGLGCLLLLAYHDIGGIVNAVREQLSHSIELVLSTYDSIGAPESTMALLRAERQSIISGIVDVLPALGVLTGAVVVLTNLLLLRHWAQVGRHVNLRLWRTPDALIWGLIVAGFAMFLPLPPVALMAQNVFIVVLACYFCQGLAIVSYYVDRFRLPRGIRVAGYILIAVQHVVTVLVLALGVFDLWGNFRRLNAGPADFRFHADGE